MYAVHAKRPCSFVWLYNNKRGKEKTNIREREREREWKNKEFKGRNFSLGYRHVMGLLRDWEILSMFSECAEDLWGFIIVLFIVRTLSGILMEFFVGLYGCIKWSIDGFEILVLFRTSIYRMNSMQKEHLYQYSFTTYGFAYYALRVSHCSNFSRTETYALIA